MKAVVVEIKNNKAAVLSDNGCVVTVKNSGYEIGQVIQMTNSKVQFTKKIAVFAASAAAFVVLGTGAWAYATPYSYVSVDVNPSIEYTVNRFDRVLSVKAVNDDGEEILQQIALEDLENQTIDAAILKTVEQFTAAGYFKEGSEGSIVITAASEDAKKADALANDLLLAVEEEVTEAQQVVVIESYSIGLNRVEEARELGVTPGKLNLVEKLQASATDPDSINVEEWLNKSVKDIMKATKDNRKASVVSGSAITMDDKVIDKAAKEQAKEEKRQSREEKKLQKDEEKSIKKSETAQKNNNETDNNLIDQDNKYSSDQKEKLEKKSDAKQKQSSKKDNATVKKETAKNISSDKASVNQEKDKQGTSKKPSSSDKKEEKVKSEDKKNAKSDQEDNDISMNKNTSVGQAPRSNESVDPLDDSNRGNGKNR